jgi:SprT protein
MFCSLHVKTVKLYFFMQISSPATDQAYALLEHYHLKAQHCFGMHFNIELTFDLKGHSTIGQCRFLGKRHYRIRLHKELTEHYQDAYLHDVLPHELAHAVVIERFKGRAKPHGKEWKETLSTLAEHPPFRLRCSLLSQKKRRVTRFAYWCECKERVHQLSAIRHNRIVRKSHVYACLVCKHPLKQAQEN